MFLKFVCFMLFIPLSGGKWPNKMCDNNNENTWTKLWIKNARKGATKQTQSKRLIKIKSEIYKRKKSRHNPKKS